MPINCWNYKKYEFLERMKIIGLRSFENNNEITIVRNLFDAYQAICSTSLSKDANVAWCVLTSAIMTKKTKKSHLISKTSH